MPNTASVLPTGNLYIDGVLSGVKWATSSLTYSFPTDPSFYGSSYGSENLSGFSAFNTTQQAAVRKILANVSAVTNLDFTEIAETSTQHADLRYAESSAPSTAWAYYPSTSASGGDAWFNGPTRYDNPVTGNYAYLTMLHETGHALGLKHAHQASGSFPAIPLDRDSLEYTVMSYRSYTGGPATAYTVEAYGYPQTLMMYDVAALQTMYGANYTTNSGDTVYKWNPLTGQEYINGVAQALPGANKILMNVWDGGGRDTYDFSNYTTGVKVDLNPGGWTITSTAQLSNLGSGHLAAGNISNSLYQGNTASLIEDAIGSSGNDTLTGNVAGNKLTGGAGNDVLDGGAGSDTAVYSGLAAEYAWLKNADGTWTVTDLRSGSPDALDTLRNVEYLEFRDGLVQIESAPLPSTNHAPTITSSASSINMTEWADLSSSETNNVAHTASGAISFTDSDTLDLHSANVNARGSGYLGTFSLNSTNINTQDTVSWSFTVSDKAIDYLKAGQSITQSYDVAIDDGHGGIATQTVTIVINGADDVTVAKTTGRGAGGNGKGKNGNGNEDAPNKSHDSHDVTDDQIPAPATSDGMTFKPFGLSLVQPFEDTDASSFATLAHEVASHVTEAPAPVLMDVLHEDHGWIFR